MVQSLKHKHGFMSFLLRKKPINVLLIIALISIITGSQLMIQPSTPITKFAQSLIFERDFDNIFVPYSELGALLQAV